MGPAHHRRNRGAVFTGKHHSARRRRIGGDDKNAAHWAKPLLVVDRGQLVGILSLRDLLEYLTLKLQFEESRGKEAAQQHARYGT